MSGLDAIFIFISLCCWALVLLLNVAATRAQYGTTFTTEASGYLVGGCLGAAVIPALGLWAFVKFGHKSLSQATKFFLVSVGAVFFALISAVPHLANRPLHGGFSPERVGQLAKEGVGQAPISRDESVWDGATRTFFSDIKAFNDQYLQEAAAVDKSAFAELYTAKSFSSRESMRRTLSQLQAVRDVDARHASLDPIFEKLKARVQALHVSESDKKAFWDGFETSVRKSMAPRDAVSEKAMKWMDTAIELYRFTIANRDAYFIQDKKLLFRKGSGLDVEFNDKLQKSLAARKEFQEQQKIFHADQRQKLGSVGLSPEDMGLHPQENKKLQ